MDSWWLWYPAAGLAIFLVWHALDSTPGNLNPFAFVLFWPVALLIGAIAFLAAFLGRTQGWARKGRGDG